MDLVFHIGCEKTGTTSLQSWFHANDAALRGHGVWYSLAFGRPNNRGIMFLGLLPGTPDEQLRSVGVDSAEQHQALQTRLTQEFLADVSAARQAGARTYVISNEHCHSRLKTLETVRRTHDLLAPHFQRMRVHCFLRPQIDMSLSLASTMSRNRRVVDLDWVDRNMNPKALYYRFDELLARWACVYGADAVVPVSLRREPDVIRYFELELGVAELGLPRQVLANTALDYRSIALMNALVTGGYGSGPLDAAVGLHFNDLPVDQRLSIDRATATRLQQRFDATNLACIEAFPAITQQDLTPEWARYPEVGNIGKLHMADELAGAIGGMVNELRLDICCERARYLSLLCDREWRRNNTRAALQACREAISYARLAVDVPAYAADMRQILNLMAARLARLEPEFGTGPDIQQLRVWALST